MRRDGCVLLIQLRLDGSTGSIEGIFFPAHGILSKEANLVDPLKLRKARISVDCFVSLISVFFMNTDYTSLLTDAAPVGLQGNKHVTQKREDLP